MNNDGGCCDTNITNGEPGGDGDFDTITADQAFINTINSIAEDNTTTVNGVNPLTTSNYVLARLNQDVRTGANPTFGAVGANTITLTTAAFHPVTVNNSSATSGNDILFQNTGTNIVGFGANQSTSEAYAWVFANQPLKIGTNNTERLRIAAAGIANDNSITSILGLSGTTLAHKDNVLDTSSVQTLSNKTLDSAANTITITSSPLSATNINSVLNQDVRTTASPTFTAVGTGLGVPDAGSELQFSTSTTNGRKLVFVDSASPANSFQYTGIGIEASSMVLTVGSTARDWVFFAATSSSARNEVFRIKGSSVGTVLPTTSNPTYAFSGKGDWAYSSANGTYFSSAVTGDVNIRNQDSTKDVNIGVGSATAQVVVANTLTAFNTDINVNNNTTNSKKLALTVANGATSTTTTTISAAQTANRTLTLPDATTTLVGTDAVQTLTNKTATSSTNTIYGSGVLTTGAAVVTSASAAPTDVGQALITTSVTNATWQYPLAQMFWGSSTTNQTYSINTTLTADVYYQNVTINSGVVVTTAGFRMFINGTLTFGNASSSINANGNNGTAGGGGGAGGAALAAGSIGGSTAGGAGGAAITPGSAGGNAPANTEVSAQAGGAGGSGNAGLAAGGAAGTTSLVAAANGGTNPLLDANLAPLCQDMFATRLTGGTGGGGGGGGVGVIGGGGGSGGGMVMVAARIVVGAGTITANGGNGGAGVSALGNSSGGGGGGGGGTVVLIHGYFGGGFTSTQVTATGGTGGAAGGTGGNAGSNGSAGVTVIF
jgi:hypothetical protein